MMLLSQFLLAQSLPKSLNSNATLSLYNPAFDGVQGDLIYHANTYVGWMNMKAPPISNRAHFEKRLDFNKRMAVGLTIQDDRLAIMSNTGLGLNFNYKKPLARKHFLSLGFGMNYQFLAMRRSRLQGFELDPTTQIGDESMTRPDMSVGLLYSTRISYWSVSIPSIFVQKESIMTDFSFEPQYEQMPVYFTYGMQIDMIRYAYIPQLSLRYVPITGMDVPVQFDFSLEYFKYGEYALGVGGSSDRSFLMHYSYKINKNQWLKYSIAIPMMNSAAFGPSHELSLRGTLNSEGFSYISGESWFKKKQKQKRRR